ncbi:hypothetical protein RSc0096 [Ralstonia pseudosolanacearum GMI1000]|uniref:Uncharacterized protein n=2 Tax=Ralstonia solanacearum species complex TaxID=3116862 RepID=A0A0S4V451_RALSL|nr:hypothetical protein RSc0096 [Ralstonia pseudosolanacearum GMI1000]CUV19787.1 conserved protein of unknown function [Ralstonia solanacearum]CUV29488.1 conserved protein of unknown function [Ralstonia solanacearum]
MGVNNDCCEMIMVDDFLFHQLRSREVRPQRGVVLVMRRQPVSPMEAPRIDRESRMQARAWCPCFMDLSMSSCRADLSIRLGSGEPPSRWCHMH